MTTVVSLLAQPIVEKLLKDADLFARKKFAEVYGVEGEMEWLKSDLTAIAAVLHDAECYCSESKSEQLTDWLTKLRDAALDAEDVLQWYATEAALKEMQKQPAPVAWLRSRSTAATKIKEIVKRMDRISKQKGNFHFNPEDYGGEWTRPSVRAGLRETSWNRGARALVGREKEKEEILSWFHNNNNNNNNNEGVTVFTITGMGGLGKTTLAQLVYNDEKVFKKGCETSHFQHAVWVNVSVNFNADKILKESVERLTEISHDKVSRSLMETSILRVLDGKPLLLVLDDVWDNESLADWKVLHNFLSSCPRGSTVLVTSRSDQVTAHMGASHTYALDKLPGDECWDLLKNEILLGTSTVDDDDDLKDKEQIGREIIKKCDFLPLAVKSMGAILRGKAIQSWKRILRNGIWETDAAHRGVGGSHILPALRLSYDYLPSSLLKQCFAYCSIFPKGHMFDKTELVKLWIAEGYISHPIGEDKLEDVGSDYFDELLSKSFFQCLDIDSNERYKMHDLIHDLAKYVSKSSQQVEENTNSIKENCRHVSFLCKDVQKHAVDLLKVKKLRTLLLPISWARDLGLVLDKMFKTLKCLRVLDLSSSVIIDLPKSIGSLMLLRYLDLSRTEIRVLPSTISDLLNLQTLKLLGCLWFKELPKDLGNLKELRYLELDEIFWFKCSALPPNIGGLTNLHNLHCFLVQRKNGYGIEELKSMNNLEGSLHISKLENSADAKDAKLKQKEGITKLVLEWSKDALTQDQAQQERILENLEPHDNLQEFHLQHYKGSKFPSWMGGVVLQNLFKVSLRNCSNCKILSLGPLPHLRQLIIKGMLGLEEWPLSEPYHSLTWLTISNCPKLQKLPHNSFHSLKVMEIKQCHALQALPMTPHLSFLKVIDNALLEDWSEEPLGVMVDRDLDGPDVLAKVVSSRNSTDNTNTLQEEDNDVPVRMAIITKKLGSLEHGCMVLTGSFFKLIELTMIKCPRVTKLPESFAPQKLKISGCPLLTTLPDKQSSQRFQYLELDKCNGASLIETIKDSKSLDAMTISNITNMASMPQLPHLPKLQSLYLHNCQDLVSLSHDDGLLRNFTSLTFLSISDCPNLETFVEEGLPTSIGCLIIKSCPKLKSFHGRNNNFLTCLTSLKDLYLEDCPILESLPQDVLPASLEHLCIRGCPLLAQHCNKDAAGVYWQMISHVTDLELDLTEIRESEPSPSSNKRFLARFTCK